MSRYSTYSEYISDKVFRVSNSNQKIIYWISVSILATVLLTLASKINFVLPFTPIPFTMQSFVVVLLSMLFGRKVMYILFLYIFEGIAGLPVFAKGGGVLYILGPTGGYILGFLVAGYICGVFAENGFDRSFLKTLFTMFVGHLIIYIFGVLWLLRFLNFDLYKAFTLGFLPFIISDFLKMIVASIILPTYRKKLN